MKQKFDLKSVVLGAFLSAVIVLSIAAATAGDPPAVEYKALRAYVYTEQFEKALNDLARQGWTVVSSSTTQANEQSTPYAVVILQRLKK
jgi:hypothetical protein